MALISVVTQQTGNLLCFIARHLLETWGWDDMGGTDDKLVFIEFNWSCLKGMWCKCGLFVRMWRFLSLQPPSVGTVATCRASANPDGRWGAASNQHRCHIHLYTPIFKKAAFHKNSIFWSCVTVGWYEIQKLTNQELKIRLSWKCLERSQDLYKIVYQMVSSWRFVREADAEGKSLSTRRQIPQLQGKALWLSSQHIFLLA